ncbi:MAG TPA: hypothetical protein EYH34_10125, partial [Planctomycetes bacterium]|nr:hypothetical protein [Planctomycetota bacterium]
MHARDLVELAALVATHAKVLVSSPEPIPEGAIQQYWTACKSRLDRWARCLKRLAANSNNSSGPAKNETAWGRGVVEEVLASELLARIWAATMAAYDRRRGQELMEPVARSVLMGQLEARHRVLALMICSPQIDAELALRLNQLRRRCERWTDMLIGWMADMDGVLDMAVNRRRAVEFARDLREELAHSGGQYVWRIMLGSFHSAFHRALGAATPNADLNGRIGASVLGCFRPGFFSSHGLPHSAWFLRVSAMAHQIETLIDQLLEAESQRSTGRDTVASLGVLRDWWRP